MLQYLDIPENIKSILSQCYAKNNKFNIRRFNILKTKEIDDYLLEIDAKPVELFFAFKNNLTSFPVCKTCGKRLRNDWYYKPREYCCSKCESNSPIVKDKIEKTTLKHFGVKCSLQNKDIQERIKQTNLKLYGSEWSTQSEIVKEKYKKTCEEKYGKGITNAFQADTIKEKIKQTNNEKYGVDNPQQNRELHTKTIQTLIHNNKIKNYEEYKNQLLSKQILINMDKDTYVNSTVYEYKCLHCGLEFKTNEIVPYKVYCPECIKNKGVSIGEKCVLDYVKSIYDGEIIENTWDILSKTELDIYIPEKHLAIEFNGDYWHSEKIKDKMYHQEKSLECRKQGIRLIHIFEYEWNEKQEICKSIIKSAIGLYDKKIYARKCVVKEISSNEYNYFLEENHLQGSTNSSIRYGLYYNDELVSVIGFGKSRFKKDEMELHRFCSKINYQVVGAFSKLIKYSNISNFVSYIDLSHFTGDGYKKIGFKEISVTPPNYKWVKGYAVLNRFQTQKHKLQDLLKENYNSKLSEDENMRNNNYNKIYDSGNIKVSYGL